MAGEIFISYRRADRAWAQKLHSQLRAEGIEAWYDAHVGAGEDWRVATAKALQASRIFVLLFSESAAESGDIAKELAAAVLEKKLIIPVRLQDIAPTGAFLYELASRNWINAYDDTEARLAELAKGLAHLVRTGTRDENILPFGHINPETGPSTKGKTDLSPRAASIAAPKRLRWIGWSGLAACVVVAAAAGSFWFLRVPTPVTPARGPIQIAVLPLSVSGAGPEANSLANDLEGEIYGQLSKNRIPVLSQTQTPASGGADAAKTIENLRADLVLSGEVVQEGMAVTVRLHLDDAHEHFLVWYGEFKGQASAFAPLVRSAAAQTVNAIYLARTGRSGKNWISAQALAAYIAGANSLTGVSNPGWSNAIAALRTVVAAAPDFAEGYAMLAVADNAELSFEPDSAAVRDEAKNSLRRALELDPRNGQAIDALSFSLPWFAWKEREASNLRAASADPSYVHAPKQQGRALWHVGRVREGLGWLKRAHNLYPLEITTSTVLAEMLASEGYAGESRSIRADVIEQWPERGLTRNIRFWTSALLGETDTALALLSDSTTWPTGINQKAANAWRAALAAKSQPARASAIKVVTEAAESGALARGHALLLLTQLGDIDGAFAQAQLYEPTINGDIPYLFLSATSPLRTDPRFMRVAIRLGLVAYWRDTGKWPDFCREPALSYNCQAEAKRLEAADPTLKPIKVFNPKGAAHARRQ